MPAEETRAHRQPRQRIRDPGNPKRRAQVPDPRAAEPAAAAVRDPLPAPSELPEEHPTGDQGHDLHQPSAGGLLHHREPFLLAAVFSRGELREPEPRNVQPRGGELQSLAAVRKTAQYRHREPQRALPAPSDEPRRSRRYFRRLPLQQPVSQLHRDESGIWKLAGVGQRLHGMSR